MKFYVGQKVVCIHDFKTLVSAYKHLEDGSKLPEIKKVYTVRTIEKGFIRLVEIVNSKLKYLEGLDEVEFDERGFAPITESSDSLSIANELVEQIEKVDRSPNKIKELITN